MDGDIHIESETSAENTGCTPLACVQDDDKYKLECAECKLLVHYRCTQLPLYQIQLFLTKGYRKYICLNCVEVPTYLLDTLSELHIVETTSSSHKKTMAELTTALKQSAEENETCKLNNLALTNKHNNVCAMLAEQANSSKRKEEELNQLQLEIEEHETSMKSFEDKEAKLRTVIENQRNEMRDQRNEMRDQRNEMRDQQEKFNEVGNPDYDTMTKLENLMNQKIENIGESIKQSLLQVINQNNKQIDGKLTHVMNQNKTYAESVKNIQGAEINQPIPMDNSNFRQIMKDAKNAELTEESDKKLRSCNIILHGVTESSDTDNAKSIDETYVKSFLEAIKPTTICKSIFRIGKKGPNKKRPIKVIMKSEADKNKIMDNLKCLKDQETFIGLSVTDDYTISERDLIKEWTEKAKVNNVNESPNSNYTWKVRGNPKNGPRLKKFLKRQHVAPQH